ncbi:MAG: transposase [Candidatus Aureabacteria bacterium]|nr:transposase [Candidatus Auribacterota bacterium]
MVSRRKDVLVSGEVYHVFSKSIAGFKIFNNAEEYSRMIKTFKYYQKEKINLRYSVYIKNLEEKKLDKSLMEKQENIVEIIAYCLMPTHFHFVLKQIKNNGISNIIANTLNSYTRYFNNKYKRKGPLWQSRFKNILVKNEEQLLHLTRYLHLNPVTSYLVDKPEDWQESSYLEYVNESEDNEKICKYEDVLIITKKEYKKFVNQRSSYQRSLKKIKDLIME